MHRIVLSDSTRLDENVQGGLRLEKGAIENLNGVDGVAPESIRCKNPGLDDCRELSKIGPARHASKQTGEPGCLSLGESGMGALAAIIKTACERDGELMH